MVSNAKIGKPMLKVKTDKEFTSTQLLELHGSKFLCDLVANVISCYISNDPNNTEIIVNEDMIYSMFETDSLDSNIAKLTSQWYNLTLNENRIQQKNLANTAIKKLTTKEYDAIKADILGKI